MTPQAHIEKIKGALGQSLPGWPMQRRMAPENRRTDIDRRRLIRDDHRESSVLLLLYPDETNQLFFVLIRRPEYDGVHSGQIALPGGAREAGESLETTALREAYEEIGIVADNIALLGALSPMYIPPSNFMVYPHVAYQPSKPAYTQNVREVAEIIEPPISILTDETIVQYEPREFPIFGRVVIPYYNIFGHKVWGATAMILSEFAAIIEQYLQPDLYKD